MNASIKKETVKTEEIEIIRKVDSVESLALTEHQDLSVNQEDSNLATNQMSRSKFGGFVDPIRENMI